jgi:hypothetical protein
MRIDGPHWDGNPRIDTDAKTHSICLSFEMHDYDDDDDHDHEVIVIPLCDIAIDDELVLLRKQPSVNRYEVDWDYSLQAKQEAIDILKGWIVEMEKQIEKDRKAQTEEQAA